MNEFDERQAKLALLKRLLNQKDSIKVTKSPSGEFSFEVKRNFDASRVSPDEIIEQIEMIYEKLERKFHKLD